MREFSAMRPNACSELHARMSKAELSIHRQDGSFNIWKGPLTDNTGKEMLAKDAVADDKYLGGLNVYVKGVEGKVPGGEKK